MLILVYRNNRLLPIAEIEWTGDFNQDPVRFAHRHGGDYIEVNVETLEKENLYG